MNMTEKTTEHPFATYIRILGKGKKGSRSLTYEEAYAAMSMILKAQVEAEQLGAFLMLMRVKEETADELAGFVSAARAAIPKPDSAITVDLDWSSYAGKRRQLPWFILSALLLSENKLRIFLHGSSGHSANRIYTEDVIRLLGLPIAESMQQASAQLQTHYFSYLPLSRFSPRLYDIIELRSLMGLRSPVHTLVRMLNPFDSDYSLQGIFHPGYRPVHQQAALQLKQAHMAVLKGEGGETERNPDAPCLVQSVHNGELIDEQWPALFKRRHIKPEQLDPSELIRLWRGESENEYAQAAIISTTAIALKLLHKASSQQDAEQLANQYWQQRNKMKLPYSFSPATADNS